MKRSLIMFGCLFLGWILGVLTFRHVEGALWEWVTPSIMREASPWLEEANVRKIGNYLVFTPKDRRKYSALILPHADHAFPGILIECLSSRCDDISYGLWQIRVFDAERKYVKLISRDATGVFTSYELTTGESLGRYTYTDLNFNGIFDVRMSLGEDGNSGTQEVNIEGAWYAYTIRDGDIWCSTPEGPREAVFVDGRMLWAD